MQRQQAHAILGIKGTDSILYHYQTTSYLRYMDGMVAQEKLMDMRRANHNPTLWLLKRSRSLILARIRIECEGDYM